MVLVALQNGRNLVQRGWCQGAPSLDERGRVVWPMDKTACRWCLGGSIVAQDLPLPIVGQVMAALWQAIPEGRGKPELATNLVFWNDRRGRTQAEVVGLYDAAIARLTA